MKTLQQIVSFRLVVAAISISFTLSAEDEADALLRGTDWNSTELLEQLKAASALMTAEVWKPSTEKARVGGKVRDPEAEAKLHARGILELDAIEKLKELPGNVRIEIYQLRMLQYSKIQPDTIKYENYVGRLLDIPDCPPEIRSENEARKAGLGSPWQTLRSQYVECLPEEVIQGRKKAYEAHTLKKIASTDFSKSPEIAGDYNGLGRMYWADGENERAERLFRAVMDQKDVQGSHVTPGQIGDAMMFLASIEIRRGNRDKALQYCRDLNAKGYPGLDNSRQYYSTPGLHATKAIRHWLDDYTPSLDNLKLPAFTDCRPYPAPQEPKYTDRFVPLTSVRFEGGADFPKDHPVFRLIGVKFKRYGIRVSDDAPFTIRVKMSRHSETPDKPEGYYLEIGDKEAFISGNDFRGTVWGVVSFIQCVDGNNKKVRVCRVHDWPVTPLRGHSGYGDDLIEFGLFNKLNFFFNQTYCFTDTGLPDLEVQYENLKYMARPFADFGLEFYVADRTPMFPKLCLTSDRTFQFHLRRHSKLASYGAGISMILDDSRYPLNNIDAKMEGGKGWRIDNQYVQRLYTAVKEKHPDVKMVFCPTYYWGPHWKNEQYTDTRQEYFKGIRTYLDPAIKVFWSGNQVKGYQKSKEQVQWFKDSAGRKPMVWQNAMGRHYTMGYGCEVINFTGWHYPGFFSNDCEGYMANATFPSRAFELAHMADALWNPERYRTSEENREDSLKRATDQLCGKGVYDNLRPGTRVLSYMDRYLWSNGMVLNPRLHEENRDEIEEMFEKADGGLKRALEIHPSARIYSGHYYVPLSTMKQLLEQFDNPRSFYDLPEYRPGQAANLKFAQKEAKLDLVRDIFANAFDFHTGKPVIAEGRLCTQYYPNSPSRKGVWTFNIDEDAIGEYELNICGRLAQEGDVKPTIRVTLNKSELYKGPAPFKHDSWALKKFVLDWEHIQKENTLTIQNISPREKWSKPLTYYLNYAIVRVKKAEGKGAEDNGLLLDGLLED